MIRSILVPVDGSPLAESALAVACAIARQHHRARVEAVSVFASPLDPPRGPTAPGWSAQRVTEDLAANARAYTAHLAERLASLGGGLTTSATALDGRPAETLVERARTAPHDLIVMTTHGHSGLSRFWLGSVADRVVRQSPVPVLLIRDAGGEGARAAAPPYTDVLVPIDDDGVSEQVIPLVLSLAGPGVRLHLLHVVVPSRLLPTHSVLPVEEVAAERATPPDVVGVARDAARRYLDRLATSYARTGLNVRTQVVVDAHPAGAILTIARGSGAQLIGLASRGRHEATRFLLGSVSDKVLRSADVPVLVVPPAALAARST
ncbi:MAG: universal stress protein [Gemmatimonadetes bacterium]|nr:universal stress protein [Gemmatimonadota bacterium]